MEVTRIINIDNVINKYFKPIENEVNENWQHELLSGFRSGHIDDIKFIIEKLKRVNNWNQGLMVACRSGHIDIVKLMIEKEANDLNYGMYNACRSGHIDIVKLMIEKGANELDWGLCSPYLEDKQCLNHHRLLV